MRRTARAGHRPSAFPRLCVLLHLALVLGAVVLGVAPARAEPLLILGDADYPPYSFLRDGRPDGIYTRVLHEAARRIVVAEVEIELLPWRRGLNEVANDRAFAIFPPYFRPVLRPFIVDYSAPLGVEEVVVFCRAEVSRQRDLVRFPHDYQGLMFANNLGFLSAGLDFFEHVQRGRIALIERSGTAGALRVLFSGEADCYAQDRLSAQYGIGTLGLDATAVGVTASVEREAAHIGYANANRLDVRDAFIRRMDAVLAEMRADGSLDRIAQEVMAAPRC